MSLFTRLIRKAAAPQCPPASITRIVDREAIAYRRVLKRLCDDVRATEQTAAFEVPMGASEAEIRPPFNRFRMDSVSMVDGQLGIAEATLSDPSSFEPLHEAWDGVMVELRPLVWNDVVFEVDGPLPDDAVFGEWLHRWSDAQGTRTEDDDGLLGVVHKLTPPETSSRGWLTSVDFGSSDIAAFASFFDVLRRSGARRVLIHSEHSAAAAPDACDGFAAAET